MYRKQENFLELHPSRVWLAHLMHAAVAQMLRKGAVLVQTALDKADEAQKEMESIPEAPTLQEQRTGAGACPCRLQHICLTSRPTSAASHCASDPSVGLIPGGRGRGPFLAKTHCL